MTPFRGSGIVALVFGASLLVGCSAEYTLALTTDEHGADLSGHALSIPVGHAIGVTLLADNKAIEDDVGVRLQSSSPTIMEIASTGSDDEFLLWGVAPGSANVEVLIDGDLEEIIDVIVTRRIE